MTKTFAFVVALALPALARAAVPAVAVMPFKDLSGQKGSIGEAIRETVTTDLKDVPGLKVIERGNIDKILAEQNLQASKADLDPLSTVKVGKLLGATLIVAGAYQKAASNVRLTARFVKVETGEIVGTAKVDGAASDMLTLQDRVTVELLKSAGIESAHVQKFAKRTRPKIKSLKVIELYGDAVIEKDDAKKESMLKLALYEDANFSYATRDLEELEKRMRAYGAAADKAQEAANRELAAKLKTESDPNKVATEYLQLITNMTVQRRYHTLIRVSRAVLANPPTSPTMGAMLLEQAQAAIVRAYEQLKDDDSMLREGEKFLQKFPQSMQFATMRILMDAAIERKRQKEEGAKEAADEIAKLQPNEQKEVCRTGPVYQSHKQYKRARKDLEQCVKEGDKGPMPGMANFLLVFNTMESGDFKATYQYLSQLRIQHPELYRNVKHLENMLPVED